MKFIVVTTILIFSVLFRCQPALAAMRVTQQPIIATAVSHQWVNAITAAGITTLSQPSFTDISGSAACSQLPALTGDLTSSSCATTFATVNSNTGSFGSATIVPVITVNGKGLITAVTTASVSFPAGVGIYATPQTPTGTLSGSATVAKWGTITKDTASGYSASTGLYTVPSQGWYHISATLEISGSSASVDNYAAVSIKQNGTTVGAGAQVTVVATSQNFAPTTSLTIYCSASDTIGIYGASGLTSAAYAFGLVGSSFSIVKVSN